MSAIDKLKPIDRAFVKAYTDPNSPTYSNGTQSLLVARPNIDPDYARSAVVRLKAKDSVRSSIQEIMDKLDFTDEVRAKRLRELINDDRRQCVKVFDGEGNLKQVIESPVKAADVGKLIDIANKMDGTYDRASLPTKLAEREYSELLKGMRKQLSERKSPQTSATEPTAIDVQPVIATDVIQPSDASTAQEQGIQPIPAEGTIEGGRGLTGVPSSSKSGEPGMLYEI